MRFNLDQYYPVVLASSGQHNYDTARALAWADPRALGLRRIAKYFPEKGFGFDDAGVFFHRSAIRKPERIAIGAWIHPIKIGPSPKGEKYQSGQVIEEADLRVSFDEKACAWEVRVYTEYMMQVVLRSIALSSEERAVWDRVSRSHYAEREKKQAEAHAQWEREGKPETGSTSWNGVGIHPDCEDYYE